jgi:hypothetical protein
MNDHKLQMSNLLIGSSNLARFYKPENFKPFSPYQMLKCTTMGSYKGKGRGKVHGVEANKEPLGNRGTKRSGDEEGSSSSAAKK